MKTLERWRVSVFLVRLMRGVVGSLAAFGMSMIPMPVALAQRVAVDAPADARVRDVMSRPVSVDLQRVSLKQAVRAVAASGGLRISYQANVLDVGMPLVTLRVTQLPLGAALERVLEGTGLRAELVANEVIAIKQARPETVIAAYGSVSGRVLDAQTKAPLRGATVIVLRPNSENHTVTTRDDGTFHVANLDAGTYTVSIRLMGYGKATRTVTVIDGQTTSLDMALGRSANALDQVIVTGTIIETAQREIPNAMTVITAKELEQRGITKIDQLFRGDVPGLFALNRGSSASLDEVVMYSRGATVLTDVNLVTNETTNNTNPIKTYVDGVELADPRYLSQLDPKSIERIEIISGPQASTIYGSNAINGVMQVFTKRGTSTSRPQLTLSLQSGWVQNNFRPTLAPRHNHSLQLQGVEGHWSYNATTSWDYEGPWTPSRRTSRLSGNMGSRLQHGAVTADGALRLAQTYNQARGTFNQLATSLRESGFWIPVSGTGLASPEDVRLNSQTLSLTMGYAATSWWSHQIGVGKDQSTREGQVIARGYRTPSDSLLRLTSGPTSRTSWRYTSTAQLALRDAARLTITAGGDGWTSLSSTLTVNTNQMTGTLGGTSAVTRRTNHNAGGFVQSQLGVWDRLFFTQGLRAEWNPNFGDDAQPNLAPRYGASYVQDVGPVTMKLRASYGRATRPPDEEMKYAQYALDRLPDYVPYYGNYEVRRANPLLGPEYQKGAEGGIELYLGRRASVIVTRYNQTVDGLIQGIQVDSVRSFAQNPTRNAWLDADRWGWMRTIQFVNFATIRNQGWEGQGQITLGPLTSRGTYSYTKSRIIGIPALDFAILPQGPASTGLRYLPGGSFKTAPEHTWAVGFTYAQSRGTLGLNFNGTGQSLGLATREEFEFNQTQTRIRKDLPTMQNLLNFHGLDDGYVMANLNGNYRLSSRVEGTLQMNNVANYYRADDRPTSAVMGRQTTLGLRVRL